MDFLLDIFESTQRGIFAKLDDEINLKRFSNKHFTTEVISNWPREVLSPVLEARNIIKEDEFIIKHFAGPVCYQTVCSALSSYIKQSRKH